MTNTTDTLQTDEKKWCAYCGVWGDHQSGYCVPLLRDREATLTHQLADARLEVERLTSILKSLQKSPSVEWHRSHKVLLK